jgi:hypothetical protein
LKLIYTFYTLETYRIIIWFFRGMSIINAEKAGFRKIFHLIDSERKPIYNKEYPIYVIDFFTTKGLGIVALTDRNSWLKRWTRVHTCVILSPLAYQEDAK